MKKTAYSNDAVRTDVYERITAAIIAELEAGTRPWVKPWSSGGAALRPLRHNGLPYRGINTLLLWMTAAERGYKSRYWMTYKQAQELGGQVRKGEKSALVVYAGAIERQESNEKGEQIERRIPFMKGYSVFCADQIDNLPDQFYHITVQNEIEDKKERLPYIDDYFRHTGADIREGGDQAFYNPTSDYIQMPPFTCFKSAEAFATTLAHEAIHWTAPRVKRDLSRYGKEKSERAREELVAELGSVFFAADMGLQIELRDDHAPYIQSWIKVLQNDKRAIIQAASMAEKALAYLHSLQPDGPAPEEEEEDDYATAA